MTCFSDKWFVRNWLELSEDALSCPGLTRDMSSDKRIPSQKKTSSSIIFLFLSRNNGRKLYTWFILPQNTNFWRFSSSGFYQRFILQQNTNFWRFFSSGFCRSIWKILEIQFICFENPFDLTRIELTQLYMFLHINSEGNDNVLKRRILFILEESLDITT